MMQSAQSNRPSAGFRPITPSNTAILPIHARGIYVGGAGNVVVDNQGDVTVTFTAVPAGTILPITPKRVRTTSTATSLILLA